MTITKTNGRLGINCDACPTRYRHTAEETAFRELLTEIVDEGWKPIRKAGDWTHLCPDCARFSDRRLL
ncbi:hypothetical protein [Rhizobium arsenicireducens]